jgi:hypothetical protein
VQSRGHTAEYSMISTRKCAGFVLIVCSSYLFQTTAAGVPSLPASRRIYNG